MGRRSMGDGSDKANIVIQDDTESRIEWSNTQTLPPVGSIIEARDYTITTAGKKVVYAVGTGSVTWSAGDVSNLNS